MRNLNAIAMLKEIGISDPVGLVDSLKASGLVIVAESKTDGRHDWGPGHPKYSAQERIMRQRAAVNRYSRRIRAGFKAKGLTGRGTVRKRVGK